MEDALTMGGRLAGKRILVVEDEYLIASDLSRALGKEDAIVVGPVGDLQQGLELVDREAIDAAVLDVNLDGRQSYAIADLLQQRAVPFVFLTGYDGWALPANYRDAPRVTKPFLSGSVLSMVERLVEEQSR